ncbi:MAG TPA: hypothetical protein VMI31_13050, partial [Fimbriimonadaceae bacterium]|nr:hypothetical protein [Fimbriimonadaceae bacterium]
MKPSVSFGLAAVLAVWSAAGCGKPPVAVNAGGSAQNQTSNPAPPSAQTPSQSPAPPSGNPAPPKSRPVAPAPQPAPKDRGGVGVGVVRRDTVIPPRRALMPPEPKPDETAPLAYATPDGSKVSVEGVCKITESDVACWGPNGVTDADLTQRIKDAMVRQSTQGGWSPSITIQYGKKNRVVVFKMSQVQGTPSYINVQSVGSNRFYGGGSNISLDQPMRSVGPGKDYIHFQTQSVAEDPSAATTVARLQYMVPVKEQATIDCRAGASVEFGGETHTIESITAGGDREHEMMMPPPMQHMKEWTLKLKSTRTGAHPPMVQLMPLDSAGNTIGEVDEKGNP